MDAVIIVLNWNGWADTKRLLASLQEHQISAPVWVVDNGSATDESEQLLELDPRVRVVRLERNLGFAGGMNRAMRLAADAGFAIVYALNNDCLVRDDFLTPLLEAARRIPELAVLGSRFLSRDKDGAYSIWGYASNPADETSFRDGIRMTDRVVGSGMLLRVEPFLQLGGFDERFFCYGEENDLCWRLLDKGYRVAICFDSLILHNHEGSDVAGNAAYYRCRNGVLLARLHPRRYNILWHLLYVLTRANESLAASRFSTMLSCVEGLHHGFLRKCGERGARYPNAVNWILFVLYSLLYPPLRVGWWLRTRRKARAAARP